MAGGGGWSEDIQQSVWTDNTAFICFVSLNIRLSNRAS